MHNLIESGTWSLFSRFILKICSRLVRCEFTENKKPAVKGRGKFFHCNIFQLGAESSLLSLIFRHLCVCLKKQQRAAKELPTWWNPCRISALNSSTMKYTWLHTNARVVHNCTQTQSSKPSEAKNVGTPLRLDFYTSTFLKD